jgi:hypothetical protein
VLLEDRERLPGECLLGVRVDLARQRVDVRELEARPEDEILPAESFRFVTRTVECDAARRPVLAGIGKDAPQGEECVHVLRARLRQKPLRTFEEVRRRRAVAAVVRATTRPREQLPRTRGVVTVVLRDRPELAAVLERPLEVVPEDLVELDELGPVAPEPQGEEFVELGTGCLGQGVVRGVPDQEVPEPVAVLSDELWLLGAEEVLPDECN